jgi:hypothetical protein
LQNESNDHVRKGKDRILDPRQRPRRKPRHNSVHRRSVKVEADDRAVTGWDISRRTGTCPWGEWGFDSQTRWDGCTELATELVVSENYPQLKSDANFRDLQSQLEGTENRITVARNRYIQSVQAYNVTVRSFPSNLTAMVFGYSVKANFTVDNEKEIAKAPKVEFGSPLAKPQAETQRAAK